jgi:hypothetical protein
MDIYLLIAYSAFNIIFTWMIVGDLYCWFIYNAKTKAFLVILALLSIYFWRVIFIDIQYYWSM